MQREQDFWAPGVEHGGYEQALSEEAVFCILDFLVVAWMVGVRVAVAVGARRAVQPALSPSLVVAGNQDSRVEAGKH